MNKALLLTLLFCCAAIVTAVQASADPIRYQEAVSGDLPFESVVGGLTLTFAEGTNTVSGQLGLDKSTPPALDDFDAFAFVVPPGTALTAITYSFATAATPGVSAAGADFELVRDSAFVLAGFHPLFPVTAEVRQESAFSAAVPLAAGTYRLRNFGLTSLGDPNGGFRQDYTWSFSVNAVASPTPEPSSLLLLGAGSVMTLARRRRARTSRTNVRPAA